MIMISKKIAIVGSGIVGGASGKVLAEMGHDVIFSDVNLLVLEKLKAQGFKTCNINKEETCLDDREIFLVSVNTPNIDGRIDLRFLESAIASIGTILKRKKDYATVVIRSTVPPGTIENDFAPILEKFSGKKLGTGFGLAMNPEFLREITAANDFRNPWIIVFGTSDLKSAGVLEDIYSPFSEKIPRVHTSIKEAEMVKYVHNIYNANKISFFNEMRSVAGKIGIDADKVFRTVVQSAEAQWSKEYGIKDKGPFGGACLPKDTDAFLSWTLDKLHKKLPLLHAIIRVNENIKDKIYLED